MRNVIFILITFVFILTACGTGRFLIKQCKQTTSAETECMTTEIEGESNILPF